MSARFSTDVPWPHRTDLPRTARDLKQYRNPIAAIRCAAGTGGRGTGVLLAVAVSEREPTIAALFPGGTPSGVLVTPHDLARLDRAGGTTQVWCSRCRVGHVVSLDRARELVDRLRRAGRPPGGWPYRLDVEDVVLHDLVD